MFRLHAFPTPEHGLPCCWHACDARRTGGPPHHPLGGRHPSPVPAYSTKTKNNATLHTQSAAKTFQTQTPGQRAPPSAAAAHLRPLGLSTRLNPSLRLFGAPRKLLSLLLPPLRPSCWRMHAPLQSFPPSPPYPAELSLPPETWRFHPTTSLALLLDGGFFRLRSNLRCKL